MSSSKAARLIAFVPFGYQLVTRMSAPRDIAYLVVSSWIPALWIAWRTGSGGIAEVAGDFSLGYLAFVSLYEIGYLANDAWDASRQPGGRQRSPFTRSAATIAIFATIRLACWAGIGVATGWLTSPLWLAGSAVLCIAMLLHNLLPSADLRLATFFQLGLLRFLLPVSMQLTTSGWIAAALCAILLYLPLRYLAYADSKDLLVMPGRRLPWFGACYLALLLPVTAWVGMALHQPVLLEVGLFLIAAHTAWPLLTNYAKGAKR